jgi:hypothetical protein
MAKRRKSTSSNGKVDNHKKQQNNGSSNTNNEPKICCLCEKKIVDYYRSKPKFARKEYYYCPRCFEDYIRRFTREAIYCDERLSIKEKLF